MEALAAETQALTALEAQLRTELRELRARREASETTLSERSAALEKGKRREAELSEQESALRDRRRTPPPPRSSGSSRVATLESAPRRRGTRASCRPHRSPLLGLLIQGQNTNQQIYDLA
jgi:chromosome segregation ATPase